MAIVVAAIWLGENFLSNVGQSSGVFWLAGEDWWAPNQGRCASCGGALVPLEDEVSACRHCPQCNVSYRHNSLPQTLEEQERIWKKR